MGLKRAGRSFCKSLIFAISLCHPDGRVIRMEEIGSNRNKPIKLRLDRDEDMILTGKRQKKLFPSDKSLKRLIDEKGVDWIYGGDDIHQKSTINNEIVKEWFI